MKPRLEPLLVPVEGVDGGRGVGGEFGQALFEYRFGQEVVDCNVREGFPSQVGLAQVESLIAYLRRVHQASGFIHLR